MRFLRRQQLIRKMGTSVSSGYRHIAQGLLPPPVKCGQNIAVWPEHEIDAVIAARIAAKTEDEIRELVTSLVKARAHALDAVLQDQNVG